MGPGEVIFMFILFVIFPAVLFNGIASVKKARLKDGEKGGEIRASELRRMIEAAVAAATAGLAARVTDLEERLGDEPVHAIRERLGGGLPAVALSAAFDPEADLDDADGRPVQRRARA